MERMQAHLPLLFATLSLEGRVKVLGTVLADLSADEVRVFIAYPAMLGLVAEAYCGVGIEQVGLVADRLSEDDYEGLVALMNETLLARLPAG